MDMMFAMWEFKTFLLLLAISCLLSEARRHNSHNSRTRRVPIHRADDNHAHSNSDTLWLASETGKPHTKLHTHTRQRPTTHTRHIRETAVPGTTGYELEFILQTNSYSNCVNATARIDVSYRTVIEGDWIPLQNISRSLSECDSLRSSCTIPLPNLTTSDEGVEFRFIQWDHEGGRCGCWLLDDLTLRNGTALHVFYTGFDSVSESDVACASFGASIDTLCETGGSGLMFCGGSASVPRGMVTRRFDPGESNGTGHCTRPQNGGLDLDLLVGDIGVSPICESSPDPSTSFIEVNFDLHFPPTDGTCCNNIDNFDEGVEFAVRRQKDDLWIPLGFFAVNSNRASNNKPIISVYIPGPVNPLQLRGYNVTPQLNRTNSLRSVQVFICDSGFFQAGVQFRWLQSARHDSNGTRDSWYIDNVNITAHTDKCSQTVLYDSFGNDVDPLNTTLWPYVKAGEVVSAQAIGGDGSEGNALVFGRGDIIDAIVRVVDSRIAATRPLDLLCEPDMQLTTIDMTTSTAEIAMSTAVISMPPTSIALHSPTPTPSTFAHYSSSFQGSTPTPSTFAHSSSSQGFQSTPTPSTFTHSSSYSSSSSQGFQSTPTPSTFTHSSSSYSYSSSQDFQSTHTVASTSTHTPFPTPVPRSYQLNDIDLAYLAYIVDDPVLGPILELAPEDPEQAVDTLESVTAGEVNETAAVLLLNLVLREAEGSLVSQEFSQNVIAISSNILSSTRDSEEPQILGGSAMLHTLDGFFLRLFNASQGEPVNSSSVVLQTQEKVGLDGNDDVLGIDHEGNMILLPQDLIRFVNQSQVLVGSFFYRNMSGLLSSTFPGEENSMHLVSAVLSSVLQCGEEQCDTREAGLNQSVVITIPHSAQLVNEVLNGGNVTCVFWEFADQVGVLISGQWDVRGCERNEELSNEMQTVCECDHLTHFAILLSPNPSGFSQQELYALKVIGTVCVAISHAALVITVLSFLCLRSLWNLRNYIHVNLCINLFIAQLIFVIGIEPNGSRVGCQVVAVLLHYFFLVTFMWMLMEGVFLYVALVRVFIKHHQKKYIIAFTLISYGLPLLYMALTVSLGFALPNGPHYASYEACWLRYDTFFIWTFIGPVILIVLTNIGFLIMAVIIMYRHQQRRQVHRDRIGTVKHWLKASISLLVVMGITWIIGVLSFSVLRYIAFISAIFIALQGLAIFILFVLLTKQVRDAYCKWWKVNISESEFLKRHFGFPSPAMTTVRGRSMRTSIHRNKSSLRKSGRKPSTIRPTRPAHDENKKGAPSSIRSLQKGRRAVEENNYVDPAELGCSQNKKEKGTNV